MKFLNYLDFSKIFESSLKSNQFDDLQGNLELVLDAFDVKSKIKSANLNSTKDYLGVDLENGVFIEIFKNENSDFFSAIKIFISRKDLTPNFCFRSDGESGEAIFNINRKNIPEIRKSISFSDLLSDLLFIFLIKFCFNQIDEIDKEKLVEDYKDFERSASSAEKKTSDIKAVEKIYLSCLGTFLQPDEIENLLL